MMRFFLISVCILCVSCSSYPIKNGYQENVTSNTTIVNPYFSNESTDYVYKANIEVYDRTFGGLLMIKKLDRGNHRIAFTTELGNKLFDFSFINDKFMVNYIVKDFDKSLLIKILKQDFKTLITEYNNVDSSYDNDLSEIYETTLYKKKHFYYYDNHTLVKINRVNGTKEKVSFLFSNISNSIAKHIDINHYNIKLKITLKSLK